ncbi:MAG TPA: phosphoglycerate mutase family protein [Gemmatimonadaceae bacterium]|nr:phosphoglycerate mutase family protein [Gemmatimonadaceae bacterium]
MRIHRALLAVALLAGCAPVQQQGSSAPDRSGTTTIVLVRHAEKAAEPAADPPLTAQGEARARALVDAVADMPVHAIVSTDFARTRATAAPLAARRGLVPEIVDARARDHARLVAEGILAHHRGETVVVVGHSNTVPDIVAALGAPKPTAICDSEYDNLFVVRVPASGPATLERRHYGASSVVAGCSSMR